MVEGGDGLGFAFEESPPFRILSKTFRQKLDGNVSVELQVSGFPDNSHAALAEFLEKTVMGDGLAGLEDHEAALPDPGVSRSRTRGLENKFGSD
jgi:hypothetical protein